MDQVSVGQRIKRQREQKGLSLQDVADRLAVNRSSVMRWENGEINRIKLPFVEKLAQILETSPGYLMGYTEYDNDGNGRSCAPEEGCFLPVLEKAENPKALLQRDNITRYELADGRLRYESCFFLIVHDNSMAPHLEEGDRLLVKQQDHLEDGQLGIFIVDEQTYLIRELHRENGFELRAFNPYYPALYFNEEESARIQIFGRILESKRNW